MEYKNQYDMAILCSYSLLCCGLFGFFSLNVFFLKYQDHLFDSKTRQLLNVLYIRTIITVISWSE